MGHYDKNIGNLGKKIENKIEIMTSVCEHINAGSSKDQYAVLDSFVDSDEEKISQPLYKSTYLHHQHSTKARNFIRWGFTFMIKM